MLRLKGRPALNPPPRFTIGQIPHCSEQYGQCVRVAVALTLSIVGRACYEGLLGALRNVH